MGGLRQFEFPKIIFNNLETEVIPSKLRLGHKIEYIFLQLLQHSQEYKVIAHNIPIRKNKVSMGEIDFLLQNTVNKEFTHVELTYKFYLIHQNSTSIEHQLIGPNQRDTFIAKQHKIINHQIPLLKTPEAISILKKININTTELQHKVCFKSQLFIPHTTGKLNLGPLNTKCIAGKWISHLKFKSGNFSNFNYYVPSKPEWLLVPHQDVEWLTYNEVIGFISKKLEDNYSPLLWVKNKDSKIEKWFIVWW